MGTEEVYEQTFSLRRLAERALPIIPLKRTSSLKSAITLFITNSNINVLPVADSAGFHTGGVYYRDMLTSMAECRRQTNVCENGLAIMVKTVPSLDINQPDKKNLPHISHCINNELSLIVTQGNRYMGILPSREVARFLYEEKLIEAQAQSPLTGLPGNLQIGQEFRNRKSTGSPFRLIYVDINNFKSFNDSKGFPQGDEAIKYLATVLVQVFREYPSTWVGHVGGDDFAVYCGEAPVERMCEEVINLFEHGKKIFYDDEDIKNGFTYGRDRDHILKPLPLIGISVAVSNEITGNADYDDVGRSLATLKTLIKKTEGGKSAYRVDRRSYCDIA